MPIQAKTRSIRRTLRQAAWAPLLVLCAAVASDKIFDVFTRYSWFDVPAHFFGGIAATYFFLRAVSNAQVLPGHAPASAEAVLALGCTATAAILWEVVEFVSDRLLLTDLQHGAGDTLSDLVFGIAGGVAYLILQRVFAASRDDEASSGLPSQGER